MSDATMAPVTTLNPDATSHLSVLPSSDPVGAGLRDVLALFQDLLAEVKFPDVDAVALAAQAVVVEDKDADVRRLEAALDEAKKRLDDAQDTLLQKAQKAVAYARVFADGDAVLQARLDAITLPRARTKTMALTPVEAPRKKRQKASTNDSGLFRVDAEAAAAVDDAAQ